jgi:hypothetical protein
MKDTSDYCKAKHGRLFPIPNSVHSKNLCVLVTEYGKFFLIPVGVVSAKIGTNFKSQKLYNNIPLTCMNYLMQNAKANSYTF